MDNLDKSDARAPRGDFYDKPKKTFHVTAAAAFLYKGSETAANPALPVVSVPSTGKASQRFLAKKRREKPVTLPSNSSLLPPARAGLPEGQRADVRVIAFVPINILTNCLNIIARHFS